jgi:acyl-CoA synthetase (AMP-forming)/AMP-acid ligase II
VPRGQPGELLLKGPQVFPGYWNNPEETAKMLLPNGWLRTGDIVTVDEDVLRAHCREHLAAYKIPRRIVQIENTPRSMLGKVLRKQVREQVLPLL